MNVLSAHSHLSCEAYATDEERKKNVRMKRERWKDREGVCVCVWCVCAFTAKSYKCVFCSDKDG